MLCSGTLPRSTTFAERVAAATDAGFRGLSLWGRDYAGALAEGWSDSDMRSTLDDHGLAVAELDPAWWWLPGADKVRIPPEYDSLDVFRFGEQEIFAMADALGARSLNAVDVFGGAFTVEEAAQAFEALCIRASEHGLVVHLEWLTWSRIPNLETALKIVELASVPNGGITVDTWHLTRADTDIEALRKVPGDLIRAIQLGDGPLLPEDDLMDAALHDRQLPGEGEFTLAGIVGALRETGTTAPLGVEVFSDSLHALGPHEAARRAASATRRVLQGV